MGTFLANYGYVIDTDYANGYVKKRYSINLRCDRCGQEIYEGWTNNWNLYCDECYKVVKCQK